jgi:hypothetical protein
MGIALGDPNLSQDSSLLQNVLFECQSGETNSGLRVLEHCGDGCENKGLESDSICKISTVV